MIATEVQRRLQASLEKLSVEQQLSVIAFAQAIAMQPPADRRAAMLAFAGTFDRRDLADMQAAIASGCGQVDVDGW